MLSQTPSWPPNVMIIPPGIEVMRNLKVTKRMGVASPVPLHPNLLEVSLPYIYERVYGEGNEIYYLVVNAKHSIVLYAATPPKSEPSTSQCKCKLDVVGYYRGFDFNRVVVRQSSAYRYGAPVSLSLLHLSISVSWTAYPLNCIISNYLSKSIYLNPSEWWLHLSFTNI